MKKALYPILMVLSIVMLFTSCAVNREALEQRKADIRTSKYDNLPCFVQFTDGTIQNFKSLKIVTGVFVTPYLLADRKTKINASKIIAYQNEDHYAVSQKMFTSGRHSYLAVETLPGFAIRIAKGKLNVYVKKYLYGSIAVDEYFVQTGEDGPILALNAETMAGLVKENPEAVAFFYNRKYTMRQVKKQQDNTTYSNNESLVYKHTSLISKN